MKHILFLTLSIILLCAVLPGASADSGMVTVRSDKQAFSTVAPAGKPVTFEDNGSMYIWMDEEDYIPNLWICRYITGMDDPVAYIHEEYPDYMKEKYGDRLVSVMKLSDYELGGKTLTAAAFVYRNTAGYLINQINLVEVRSDGNVVYQARYPNGDEETPEALDAAIRYYQPDGAQASAPQQGGTSSQQGGASSGASHSFTVTNIKQDNMIVGRCVTPAGFTVASQAYCCTEKQCLDHPWLLYVGAASPDGITLEYLSAQGYYSDSKTQDGTFVTQYLTPALHYMSAAEYCDYWATMLNPGAKISLVEENTYPEMQSMLRQREQAYLNQVNSQAGGLGITAERDSRTVCTRCYYVSGGDGNSYFIISTSTHGIWMNATLAGPLVTISSSYTLWEAPYVYAMNCPEALWAANRDIFTVFTENTSVNDQFLLANQKISSQLQSMLTGVNLIGGESYSRRVMQETTSSGDDYNDERFTDYMFDQNDYTLSDGSHIKISTAYDYVYEGDNGVVYYSNSAFSQPGGSTQLSPNR